MLKNILLTKQYLYMFATFILGLLAAGLITIAYAHGGDTNLVHSCIDGRGNITKVGESESCQTGETALDWNKNAYFNLPFMCKDCYLYRFADKFAGKDFSNSQLNGSSFVDPNGVGGANLQGVILTGAWLNGVVFQDADLTNANLNNLYAIPWSSGGSSSSFENANLTDANLSNSDFTISNFDDATIDGTDFTDTDLTGSHFVGATLTGVVWDNTICPDGTNSDSHSNTCAGHLTP